MSYISKYTGQQIDNKLDEIENKANTSDLESLIDFSKTYNLIINGNFANPINTSGSTIYKGAVSTIDKWSISTAAWMLSVDDGYITVSDNPDSTSTATGMLRQYIQISPDLRGKQVTLIAEVKGIDVRLNINNTKTGLYSTNEDWHIRTITETIPEDATEIFVALQSRNQTTYSCKWIALYVGEYSVEKRPSYTPNSYQVENLNSNGALISYPIGSIYQSTSSVSPANLFGGTWEKIEGRFLFASNSNYPVGDTGGETRHTLTSNELPKLTGYITMHSAATATNIQAVGGVFSTSINNSSSYKDGGTAQGGSYSVGNINFSVGNNESHNNMPPYLVINVWKRIA